MKYIYAFFCLCLLNSFSPVNAQISVTNDTMYTKIVEEPDIAAYNSFANVSSDQKTIVWTRTVIDITDGWTTAICDQNTCYLPHVDTKSITLGPNATSILDFHVYTNNIFEGYAFAEIKLEHEDNSQINNFAYFIFDSNITATSDINEAFSFNIYPNPSDGLFKIDDETKDVQTLIVYDQVGYKLFQIDVGQREWINLAKLQAGNYFITLLDKTGSVLGNKMISKI